MSLTETQNESLRLDHQLCFPLYAAARKITGAYTPFLKPLGLTYTQYIVLMVLWEQDGVPVGTLSKRLFLDSGTLTPLLKKMEQEGLVERRRSAFDERSVLISLTDKGRTLKEQVKDVPSCMGKCVPLSPEEAGTLYALLYKLLGNCPAAQD